MKDGKDMLIVIDGVDELFDIKGENFFIFEFLDTRKPYGKSKLILTGRPHVESLLARPRIPIGGYKVVEIMGLGDKDIEEYSESLPLALGRGAQVNIEIQSLKQLTHLFIFVQFYVYLNF